MLKQILWQSKNKWQIIGAAIGTFIGFLLLLLAVQFYQDLQTMLYGNDNQADGYVIINKQVSLFNALGGASTFTNEDIEQLNAQSFIKDVGQFTSNQFEVRASSQMIGFRTELFLEAVPDRFLDIKPRRWKWNNPEDEVPLILSRDYLALWNFGFAPSQGYPQFTLAMIKQFSFSLTVYGNGSSKTFRGRIVGLSDRINSIVVPEKFLNYANQQFGSNRQPESARLILASSNPSSQTFQDYLADNNFEVSSGRVIGEQVQIMLNIVISLIAIIGGIIVFLSFLVFVLNYRLMIAESSQDIRLLLQLGYRNETISQVLIRQLFYLFGGVLLSVLVAMLALRYGFVQWITNQGFELSLNFGVWTYIIATLFIGLFFSLNWRIITQNVKALA